MKVSKLLWEDTTDLKFDNTIVMGHGFCFDGWESLRQETETPIGRFAIWKEMSKNVWSAYGGKLGWLALHKFTSEEEAKNWVIKLIEDYEI